MIKKFLAGLVTCLFLLVPCAQAHQPLLPIIFAAGVTLPNTKKVITPVNTEVEEHLLEALNEKFTIGFVHNVENRNPWYGVVGTVVKQIPATKHGKLSSFKLKFGDLLQIHNPSENIARPKDTNKKKFKGRHYCRRYTAISDIDSPQIVSAFVREFMLPRIPTSIRSRTLQNKLNKAGSINQVLLDIIDHCKLRITEEQAIRLLEFNFSVQDKTALVMELLAEKAHNTGSSRGDDDEIEKYREQLASLDVPEEVRSELTDIIDQYDKAQNNPHEAPMLSRYLKFAFALPWNTSDPEQFDLAYIENKLHKEQFGMDEVKERVIDYLALRNISPTPPATVLCLVGPPGVGKTSIVKIVADAMGKKYSRVALEIGRAHV